jgi:hypothetical protein
VIDIRGKFLVFGGIGRQDCYSNPPQDYTIYREGDRIELTGRVKSWTTTPYSSNATMKQDKTYTINEDGYTITLNVRSTVKFNDGRNRDDQWEITYRLQR